MARKKAQSLEEQRLVVEREYKATGKKKVVRGKREESELTPEDREWLRVKAVFLKANDASYSFISDAILVPKATIKDWFTEPAMQARVAEVRKDMVTGAVKYLKTYAVELIEELVGIAKNHQLDPSTRLKAITEGLDRMGISKVNKSESVVSETRKHEFDIADPEGMLDQLQDNPQLALAAANKVQELRAIVTEGSVK